MSGYVWIIGFPWFPRHQPLLAPRPPQHDGLQSRQPHLHGGPRRRGRQHPPATSNHPGGVDVCMADGSVKFIKDSVNLATWCALGTRVNAF
ncbi:H-X9-DG-CTERM domain-containing protein [Singulisphaera sp. PoT]|uniref:H-X9-DG-CTERM domain-containing protein n=1 Tax=Singulisphaera sp. PoT TaxID=3411797 RepID=UPI003BF5936A